MKFKLAIPTKRDIERIFKGRGRNAKKKMKMTLLLFAIVIFLLLGVAYLGIQYKKPQVANKRTPSNEEIPSTVISQDLAYRSADPNAWLYASDNINYDDVYDLVVLNEKSKYSILASRKEKAVWLDDYLNHFGWSYIDDEENVVVSEPEMVSLSLAIEIGSYCGFTRNETLSLLGQ